MWLYWRNILTNSSGSRWFTCQHEDLSKLSPSEPSEKEAGVALLFLGYSRAAIINDTVTSWLMSAPEETNGRECPSLWKGTSTKGRFQKSWPKCMQMTTPCAIFVFDFRTHFVGGKINGFSVVYDSSERRMTPNRLARHGPKRPVADRSSTTEWRSGDRDGQHWCQKKGSWSLGRSKRSSDSAGPDLLGWRKLLSSGQINYKNSPKTKQKGG